MLKKGTITIVFKNEMQYIIKQDNGDLLKRSADKVTISFDKSENDDFYKQYNQLNALIAK